MDREQDEMQFMGILDIYKESYKVILTCKQIFTKITLSLILPISFIFLAHIYISDLILSNIIQLDETKTRNNNNNNGDKKLSDMISKEWAYYLLLKAAYFTFFFIFSLLSTSAVVYTVASIYTGRDITFAKVMSVVPKVWKRLMHTFLYIFLELCLYNIYAAFVYLAMVILVPDTDTRLEKGVKFVFSIVYFMAMVYLSIVFQLGSVVSVLEDAYGNEAMVESKGLIKGKIWVLLLD